MLVVFHFPCVDLRRFAAEPVILFPKPEWPTPEPGKRYMRQIGMIVNREIEDVKDSPGDDIFCHARYAFRMGPARPGVRLNVSPDAKRTYLRCAFRRLFSDGVALHRFELGWSVPNSRISSFDRPILEVAADLLRIPVGVGSGGQPAPIANAAGPLGRLIEKSSQVATAAPSSGSLEARRPLLLLTIIDVRGAALSGLKEIPFADHSSTRPRVFSGNVSGAGGIWRLVVLVDGFREEVRSMRLAFLRLHAEVEAIRAISSAVVSGRLGYDPSGPTGERVSAYFESAGEMLFQKKFFGLPTSPIFNALIDNEALAVALQISSTQLVSSRATRQVEQAIKINRRIHVNSFRIQQGDNSSINNLNNVQGSDNSSAVIKNRAIELKTLLDDFQAKAKSAIAELPPEQQKPASAHLERVLEESRREAPDRKFWELSKDGLIEATKTVTKIIPSLISAAVLVAKFLFP